MATAPARSTRRTGSAHFHRPRASYDLPNSWSVILGRLRAPVPQVARRAADRRLGHRRAADRHASDIEHFAAFTGDTFYAHTDEEAAAANPLFGGIVAHGYLVLAFAAGLFVSPGARPGARQLRAWTSCASALRCAPATSSPSRSPPPQITPRDGVDYGDVRWDVVVTNQDDTPVASYQLLTLVAKEWP